MGAQFGYFGSHFIAAAESLASPEQKAMMCSARAADITHTPTVTGVAANFLTPSLAAATLPDGHGAMNLADEAKAWKTVWSAGHGVGATREMLPAAEICARLIAEYRAARAGFCG